MCMKVAIILLMYEAPHLKIEALKQKKNHKHKTFYCCFWNLFITLNALNVCSEFKFIHDLFTLIHLFNLDSDTEHSKLHV